MLGDNVFNLIKLKQGFKRLGCDVFCEMMGLLALDEFMQRSQLNNEEFPFLYRSGQILSSILHMSAGAIEKIYSHIVRPTADRDAESFKQKQRRSRLINQNKVTCAVCSKVLPSMLMLNEHFAKTHYQTILDVQGVNSTRINSKTAKHRLIASASIKRMCRDHYSEERGQDVGQLPGKFQYTCPCCNYRAKWPTELLKHVMVHARIRPYLCPICSTSYKWSWDLGRHFSNSHPLFPNPFKKTRLPKRDTNP
ncbi:hypothetical protein Ciccas_012942 [Cichlidogyrus casuarinus]|uniref:C2H2-type domain-containing protein n=1 Tax=Cichlidogyrus casuarinus TaxID=1844966 RepID=A0ABD2PLX3_9PLAT